ncbi:hypothetical protein [Rhodocaloribacter sp.]
MSRNLPADRLCVRKVRVQRLYDHDFHGLSLTDLVEGINIVYGPNGRGKTSLAHSLHCLLWPDLSTSDRPSLEGEVDYRGERWSIRLEAGTPYVRREEEAATWVPPPADHRERYYLSLHELLQADDAPFARAIMRDAVGGLDPETAKAELDFRIASGRATKVTQETKQALDTLRQARRTQEHLKTERDTLVSLRAKLDRARQARARLTVLEQVLTLHEARKDLEEAKLALDVFPEAMKHVRGDERARLDNLDPTLIEHSLEQALTACEEAKRELTKIPLPTDGLRPDLLPELRNRLEQLKDHDHERARLGREVEQTRAQAAKAWSIIDGALDPDKAKNLDREAIHDLGETLKNTQKWRLKLEVVRDELRKVEDAGTFDASKERSLRQGIDYLRRWLRTPEATAPDATPPGRSLIAGAAVLLAVAGLVGALWFSPWALSLLLIALVLGWVWRRQKPANEHGLRDNPRRSLQHLYQDTGLEAPVTWTDAVVNDLLHTLEKRLETVLEKKETHRRFLDLSDQYQKLEKQREAFVRRHRELGDRIGIELRCSEQELFVVLTRLERWTETTEALAGHAAAREEADRQYRACLDKINETLAALNLEPVDDHAGAAARIHHLEALVQRQKEARTRREQAEKDLQREQENLEKTRRERREIFEALALAPEDLKSLHDLIDQYEAYQETLKKVQDLQTRVRLEERRLRKLAAFDEDALSLTSTQVEEALDTCREQVEEIDELQEKIADVEARVRQAEEGRTLEQARHAADEHLDRLEAAFETDLRATLGSVLVNHLQEQTHDQVLPNVFHKARALFSRITRGRYRLEMDASRQTFQAYDTVKEHTFELEELSSGTRVQLLLAVRIAFVEHHEQGLKLPLLMDETLANSDEVKANAIIDAVIELSKNGRQVFYFTAREDEVAKWIRRAGQEEHVSCRIISLDENTTTEDLRARTLPVPFLDHDVPPPEGRTHADYGDLLRVPPWDGYQPLGALHLWYVVEDPEALYLLLRQGISRWGPLITLYPAPEAAPELAGGAGARAAAYVHALSAWQEGWRIGRGRPVDRNVLIDSGAVSDKFLDAAAELCEKLEGDGRKLIRALRDGRIKSFRSNKADQLEDYLREMGYVDDRQPLSEAEIKLRVRQAVEDAFSKSVLTLEAVDAFFRRLHRKVVSPEIEA